MPVQQGAFIAIEGCEGAGKTHLITGLKQRFGQSTICYTREPGGTEVGKAVRSILMNGKLYGITPETEFFLFLADRNQHVQEVIIPACASGTHVISDRYDGSTFAYQIAGHGHRSLEVRFWNSRALFPSPNLYLYLKIDPEIGLSRIASRPGEKTHFDQQPLEFHKRVAGGYEEFFTRVNSTRMCCIDASLSAEEVLSQACAAISKIIDTHTASPALFS